MFLNATLCSHFICLVWAKCLIALCPSFAVLNIFLTSSGVSTSPNSSFIDCALAVTPAFFAALFACLYIYRSYYHPVFLSSSLPLSYTFLATLHLIIHPRCILSFSGSSTFDTPNTPFPLSLSPYSTPATTLAQSPLILRRPKHHLLLKLCLNILFFQSQPPDPRCCRVWFLFLSPLVFQFSTNTSCVAATVSPIGDTLPKLRYVHMAVSYPLITIHILFHSR